MLRLKFFRRFEPICVRAISNESPTDAKVRNSAAVSSKDAKPFSEIPHPRFLPFFGSTIETMRKYKADEVNKILADRLKKFGSIFRDKMMSMEFVSLADPKDVENMYRNEGKYPKRMEMPMWVHARKKFGLPLGVFLADDEQWHRTRKAVDKPLLVLNNIYKYVPILSEVSAQLVEHLWKEQQKLGTGHGIPIKEHLFRWSMESICAFLYDRRIGCLTENPPPNAIKFANAIEQIFITSQQIYMLQPWVARLIAPKVFMAHMSAWATVFVIGQKYIDESTKIIEERKQQGKEVTGLLAHLMDSTDLNKKEILAVVNELMSAAVDTTVEC